MRKAAEARNIAVAMFSVCKGGVVIFHILGGGSVYIRFFCGMQSVYRLVKASTWKLVHGA